MPKSTAANIEALNVQKELTSELKQLAKEVKRLKSMELIQVLKNPWKFMGFSFLKGLMVGFGSVLGASVLVGLFVYLLAQVSLVPYVGDFVQEVVSQIQLEKVGIE